MTPVTRAIRKARTEGFASLLESAPRVTVNFMRPHIISVLNSIVNAGLGDRLIDESRLEQIAEDEGRWFDFEPTRPFEIPPPDNLPTELSTYSGEYSSRPRFIAELPEGCLLGHDGVVLDSNRNIVLESIGGDRWFMGYLLYRYAAERRFETIWDLVLGNTPDSGIQYGTVFPLLGPHSRTYFHWMAEFLPRLRALEDWEAETGEQAEILINPDSPPWKVETLRCLGIDSERWSEYEGSGNAERILVAPYSPKRTSLFTPSPDDYRWLRERMTGAAVEPNDGCPRRLLISRRDAPNRRVVNEETILRELSSLGIERIVPGEYSVPEQIALFSGAETVIGPHGAGLVNTIFSESTQLVECFQPDVIRPYFYLQSVLLGHSYDCVIGQRHGKDMEVPVSPLRNAIIN